MMRLLLISIFVLSGVFTATAQEQLLTDSTVTVVPNWKKGDKILFLITKLKTRTEGRTTQVMDSMGSYAELSVLDTEAQQYTMQCRFIPLKKTPASADASSRFLENLVVKYRVTQTGAYAGLLNGQEIKDAAYLMIDKTVKERKIKDPRFSAEMKKLFSTPENIEGAVMRDVLVYHTIYGGEFTLNQKKKEPALLPNVLGGDPLPAILTTELSAIDTIKNNCTIKITQELDPDKKNAALAAWRKKYVKTRDFKMPDMSVRDNINVRLDLVTGWLTEITNTRTVVVNGIRVVERATIKKAG